MNFETKKRVLRSVMIVLAIWPIAHYVLTAAYDVCPWKLFGWGMYAAPQRNVRARILEIRGDTVIDFNSPVPVPLRDAFVKFQIDRVALGELLRPDNVGDMLLEAFPKAEGFMIVVATKKIDAKTAHIVEERENYTYFKLGPESGAPSS